MRFICTKDGFLEAMREKALREQTEQDIEGVQLDVVRTTMFAFPNPMGWNVTGRCSGRHNTILCYEMSLAEHCNKALHAQEGGICT